MRVGEEIGEARLKMRDAFGMGEILVRRHEFHPLAFVPEHNELFHFRRQLRHKKLSEVVMALIATGPDHVMF